MSHILEVENLSKSFGNKTVLNKVSFKTPEHSIYAFLGNNGAGKSTTIRILLGLLNKDSGSIKVSGQEVNRSQVAYRRDIGCIIDSPALYQELTGLENLTIFQKLKQVAKSDIARVLNIVDMSHAQNTKVCEYSPGMKQRLSLAIAMLGSPKLLILDEPTNGLDPNGIIETRELIKTLPEQTGATVFISSHLLDEVEKMASHVAIIKDGTIALDTNLKQLLDKRGSLNLSVDQIERAQQLIHAQGLSANIMDDQVQIRNVKPEQCAEINKLMIQNDLQLFQSKFHPISLEQTFCTLVKS